MSGKIVQYTFQVSEPSQLATFYRDTLGMKVLRHEEIYENSIGCIGEGGVYHNAWSKTVFGYFPERLSFSLEAHFNRNTGEPIKENQLYGITIRSHDILKRAKYLNVPKTKSNNKHVLISDRLRFFIIDEPKIENKNPIIKITLQSTNLKRTLNYWHCLLGLKIFSKKRRSVVLGFDDKGIKIKFVLANKQVTRGKGCLKIASPLPFIEKLAEDIANTNVVIDWPLSSLHVNNLVKMKFLTLSDPDAHLICFVDEKSFSMMATTDVDANKKLNRFLEIQKRLDEFKEPSRFFYGENVAEEENQEREEYLYGEDVQGEQYGESRNAVAFRTSLQLEIGEEILGEN